jgi:hypothetical protein
VRQEWECRYLLSKARRLRDASATLTLHQASNATMASSQVAAYVATRVAGGAALPEVRVEGLGAVGQLRGGKRTAAEEGGLTWEEQVVKHMVEGLRGELVRELIEGLLDV